MMVSDVSDAACNVKLRFVVLPAAVTISSCVAELNPALLISKRKIPAGRLRKANEPSAAVEVVFETAPDNRTCASPTGLPLRVQDDTRDLGGSRTLRHRER